MAENLTRNEVLDRLQAFVAHAGRVRAIKDQLTYSSISGKDPERLSQEIQSHDEMVAEIQGIYRNHMLPIMEEIAEFIGHRLEDTR
ncbi:MAG: hypothetical protein AB1758_17705 [Candidatus Eremiobacterota bacterium]